VRSLSISYLGQITDNLQHFSYCEIIINRGVLIFADFVVHLNHENKNQAKYNFTTDGYL